MASSLVAKVTRQALTSARLSSPSSAATLIHRRGFAGAADHPGPARVACWKDPMSPSKWKEEHIYLKKRRMWGLSAACLSSKFCDSLFNWLGCADLWGIQDRHWRQERQRREISGSIIVKLRDPSQAVPIAF